MDGLFGDNTDGTGLVRDLTVNLETALAGRRILLMGAGGAARGVVQPLLEQLPERLVIANRTAEKAMALTHTFSAIAGKSVLAGGGYEGLEGAFDVVINATAASLAGELPPLPDGLFAEGAVAYDMMYGQDTPFLAFARARGVRAEDGLGMLVEQAAEAFHLWRGVHPDTAAVIRMLRTG